MTLAWLLIGLALVGNTLGTGFAVAHGVQAVRPSDRGNSSYVIIRPGQDMVFSAATIRLLQRSSAGVAVNLRYASHRPGTVKALARAGVPILNGAADPADGTSTLHRPAAIRSGTESITRLTGVRPSLYLPGRRVNSLDLLIISRLRERVVQPQLLDDTEPATVHGHEVILIDCSRQPECPLPARLANVRQAADRAGIDLIPVTELVR